MTSPTRSGLDLCARVEPRDAPPDFNAVGWEMVVIATCLVGIADRRVEVDDLQIAVENDVIKVVEAVEAEIGQGQSFRSSASALVSSSAASSRRCRPMASLGNSSAIRSMRMARARSSADGSGAAMPAIGP
jgi:hypothetical protein